MKMTAHDSLDHVASHHGWNVQTQPHASTYRHGDLRVRVMYQEDGTVSRAILERVVPDTAPIVFANVWVYDGFKRQRVIGWLEIAHRIYNDARRVGRGATS